MWKIKALIISLLTLVLLFPAYADKDLLEDLTKVKEWIEKNEEQLGLVKDLKKLFNRAKVKKKKTARGIASIAIPKRDLISEQVSYLTHLKLCEHYKLILSSDDDAGMINKGTNAPYFIAEVKGRATFSRKCKVDIYQFGKKLQCKFKDKDIDVLAGPESYARIGRKSYINYKKLEEKIQGIYLKRCNPVVESKVGLFNNNFCYRKENGFHGCIGDRVLIPDVPGKKFKRAKILEFSSGYRVSVKTQVIKNKNEMWVDLDENLYLPFENVLNRKNKQ